MCTQHTHTHTLMIYTYTFSCYICVITGESEGGKILGECFSGYVESWMYQLVVGGSVGR